MSTQSVAQVFDLHALKDFASDKRVRKMLFKTDQLWSEIACYEPGQSTVMHHHPHEEEAIFVLEGTANMSVGGAEHVVPATVPHDVRNLGPQRCVIMFLKVNPSTEFPATPKWPATSSTKGPGGAWPSPTCAGCSSTTASRCPCTT